MLQFDNEVCFPDSSLIAHGRMRCGAESLIGSLNQRLITRAGHCLVMPAGEREGCAVLYEGLKWKKGVML